MSKKMIHLLCADADREAMRELLGELRARGLPVSEGAPGKDDVVLAALSEAFYADSGKTEVLLDLVAAGAENVLPLQLDASPIPDTVKNALYARNIIPAAGRDAAHTAERIAAAIPDRPSVLPKLLIAGTVVLAAIIGLLIWRANRAPAPEEIVPAPAEEEIYIPEGLTAEDLEKIVDLIIVGEQMEFYTKDDIVNAQYPDWDYFAYRDFDNDGAHWYSRDDGHEYRLTRYEDLRFLELMPNLHCLTLAQMEAERLPELSKLGKLERLMLMDSVFPDLDWVADSFITKIDFLNSRGNVSSYAALTSCGSLREVHIDLIGQREADFTGFAPPKMSWLWINNGEDLRITPDLSALSACTRLRECQLEFFPITDLSFLSNASGLLQLRLFGLHQLRDISALGSMANLRELQIEDCDAIGDFGAVARCTALERFAYRTEGFHVFRDASVLSDLPRLNNISLQNVDLPDVEFLRGVGEHQGSIDLDLTGNFDDYSALEAITHYKRLNLDPGDGTPLTEILPYLEGAQVQDLCLRRFAEVDLAALPRPSSRLELDRCGITDLGTMPEDWKASRLNLNKCSTLRSLDGLQNQNHISVLEIFLCPRMTDWSALEGMKLSTLAITGGYTLPEGVNFQTGTLRIDSVADVSDLSFLDSLDAEKPCSFELVGLDDLQNLQPLSRFHGAYLAVSPQLAEQAQDLVKAGNYHEYRIEFPEGGWEMDEMEISLLSLDELDTLPPALLRRVEHVCLVGDTVVDISQGDVGEDWSNGEPTPVYHRWGSDEETPIAHGPGFEDILEKLSKLTGLKDLRLYQQPIRTLDGIQSFSELEEIQIVVCRDLRDASAAFACPSLRFVRIDNCPIPSIQGVQNLQSLTELNINGSEVTDLSPLTQLDLSLAMAERGGFGLCVNAVPVEDYSPLATIPVLDNLDINDTDAGRFLPYLEGVEVHRLSACNVFPERGETDSDASFAAFVRSHPQLRELWIPWNPGITDLTPLLELEGLEYLRVSYDMEEAIASLDERDIPFTFEIEGQ